MKLFTEITSFENSNLLFGFIALVSPLYYGVACNAGFGQSPYP